MGRRKTPVFRRAIAPDTRMTALSPILAAVERIGLVPRGALAFSRALDIPDPEASASPCESCRERWCLHACPVGAFSLRGYDVGACAAHLNSAAGADCMAGGCAARRACPVVSGHAHGPE